MRERNDPGRLRATAPGRPLLCIQVLRKRPKLCMASQMAASSTQTKNTSAGRPVARNRPPISPPTKAPRNCALANRPSEAPRESRCEEIEARKEQHQPAEHRRDGETGEREHELSQEHQRHRDAYGRAF